MIKAPTRPNTIAGAMEVGEIHISSTERFANDRGKRQRLVHLFLSLSFTYEKLRRFTGVPQ